MCNVIFTEVCWINLYDTQVAVDAHQQSVRVQIPHVQGEGSLPAGGAVPVCVEC